MGATFDCFARKRRGDENKQNPKRSSHLDDKEYNLQVDLTSLHQDAFHSRSFIALFHICLNASSYGCFGNDRSS